MKVLVVDDMGASRHHLSRLVERCGHTAVTASTGLEALDLLQRDLTITAVICDLLMPGMDGIEFLNRAQAIHRLPPQIILTTYLRPGAHDGTKEADPLSQAKELAFFDVMLKPIDLERLRKNLAMIAIAPSALGKDLAEVPQTLHELTGAIKREKDKGAALAICKDLQNVALRLEREVAGNESARPSTKLNLSATVEALNELASKIINAKVENATLAMCDDLQEALSDVRCIIGLQKSERASRG